MAFLKEDHENTETQTGETSYENTVQAKPKKLTNLRSMDVKFLLISRSLSVNGVSL